MENAARGRGEPGDSAKRRATWRANRVYAPHVLSVIGLALDAVGAVGLALALLARARFTVGYGGPAWPDEETEATAHGFASIGVTFLPAGFILQAIPYLGWAPECSRGVTLLVGVATLALGTLELCETRWWVESSTAKTRTAKTALKGSESEGYSEPPGWQLERGWPETKPGMLEQYRRPDRPGRRR